MFKRFSCGLSIVMGMLLLTSCATTSSGKFPPQPNPKVFCQNYDSIWNKAIHLFRVNNYYIEKQDYTNGFIQSSWITPGGAFANFIAVGISGESLLWRMTVNVKKISDVKTEVYVSNETAWQNQYGKMRIDGRNYQLENQFLKLLEE
ncbi:MAG: hypothetical protein ABH869_03785 [Candidatus Omnitrophota bacterium]